MSTTVSSDPGWPIPTADIIQRLPAGVDYSFVKMIIFSAPLDPLTTLLLRPDAASSPITQLFRTGSYGTILGEIEARETRVREALDLVGEASKREALRSLTFLKCRVYEALIGEPEVARQGRFFARQLVPTGYDDHGHPRYINPPLRLQVWTRPRVKTQQPRLISEQILSSGEQYPEAFCRAVKHLLEKHCNVEKLVRLRFHSTWWTKRSPEGWPVVTQHLVPALYDFLWPYYPKRSYEQKPAFYPRQLVKDMSEILREELPHLCRGLTWRRVQAAVQTYLKTANPERPMGKDKFRVKPARRRSY